MSDDLADDKLVALRRTLVLNFIEVHNINLALVQTLVHERDWWREYALRLMWENLQLVRHVPPEVAEQTHVEAVVNAMDPDFSFERAIEVL